MRGTRRHPQVALTELYKSLPAIRCQGLCHDSCGPIVITRVEQARIRRWHGKLLPLIPTVQQVSTGADCSLLVNRRCTVYADRPLICRLWGLVEGMPCPHGCRPEGGLMTDEQGHALLRQVQSMGD